MIIIGGTIHFNPDHRQPLLAAIQRMVTLSQAEAGCVAYEFSADLTAPDVLHVFEVWQDTEAWQTHRNSAHMAEFLREASPNFTEINLKRYTGEEMS